MKTLTILLGFLLLLWVYASAQTLELVGQVDFLDCNGVDVAGDYAYVAAAQPYDLVVVNISDRSNPMVVWSNSAHINAYKAFVLGSYLYLAGQSAFEIYDISDPARPDSISYLPLGNNYGIFVQGSFAYLASSANDLVIIDISDPHNPVETSRFEVPGCP